MAVDRLSVTVPSELGAALRALADQRGETVSTVVTEAIAHQVRLAALDLALAEAAKRHGPLPKRMLDEAAKDLGLPTRRRQKSRR